MRFALCLLLTIVASLPARATSLDDLYAALQTSDTLTVERFVETYYRDAGISVNETLVWEHQRFDEIVNWYNQHTETIMLSELPRPAEVDAYWQNWSQVLTQGNWAWQSFFADPAEAALLANFNQLLLAAHEYGHALTFRYDPDHESRYDNEINCREYLPDRLAAALLQELAEKDVRIAALKSRYGALIDQINGHIAPQYRYVTPTFAALDADCRVMHVEQPTADSMTPYASAFFVRHALLQATDLPPLAAVYEQHLFSHWRALQPPASGLAGPVTTGAPLAISLTPPLNALDASFEQYAFDPSGALHLVQASVEVIGAGIRVSFGYGPAGSTPEIIAAHDLPDTAPGLLDLFDFSSALAFGPDRFVVLSGSLLGGMPAVLFDLRRTAGVWGLAVTDIEPDAEIWPNIVGASLAFGPDATPYAFLYHYPSWRRLKLDAQTLAPLETTTIAYDADPTPVAVGPAGESYFFGQHQIVVIAADGVPHAFAGARLQGFKDNADPLLAEFARPSAEVHLGATGLNVLDFDPAASQFVLRTVAPAP